MGRGKHSTQQRSSLGAFFGRGAWFSSTAGAQIASAAVGLGTNVLYSRLLTAEVFGVVAVANAISLYAAVVVDRGSAAWLTRLTAELHDQLSDASRVAIRLALPPIVVGTLLASLLLIFGGETDLAVAVAASLALTTCTWFYNLAIAMSQGLGATKLRSISILINAALTFVISAGLLHVEPAVWTAVCASAIAYILAGLWLLAVLRVPVRELVCSPLFAAIRASNRGRRRLFATNVANYAIVTSDLVVVTALLGPTGAAGYQVAKKISQGLIAPLLSTNAVLLGRMASQRSVNPRPVLKVSILTSSMVMAAAAVIWCFGGKVIGIVFGDQYSALTPVVLLTLSAYYLQFVKDLLATLMNAWHRDSEPVIANVLVLAVFICGVVILRPSSLPFVVGVLSLALAAGVTFLFGCAIRGRALKAVQAAAIAVPVVMATLAVQASAWLTYINAR